MYPDPTPLDSERDAALAPLTEEQARAVLDDYLRSVGKGTEGHPAERGPGCWSFRLGAIPRGVVLTVADDRSLHLSSCLLSKEVQVTAHQPAADDSRTR